MLKCRKSSERKNNLGLSNRRRRHLRNLMRIRCCFRANSDNSSLKINLLREMCLFAYNCCVSACLWVQFKLIENGFLQNEMSFTDFAICSMYLNSVTNSISSLLWISIVIHDFKSHYMIMSAIVYFMKTVNGYIKDVSIMSPQDVQWRRTSLLCLYTAIFLFY